MDKYDLDLWGISQEEYSAQQATIEKEQQAISELIYVALSNQAGEKLLAHLKEILQQQRWSPSENSASGYYREGGAAAWRYLISNYENYQNRGQ